MSFKRFVETGRVAYISGGRYGGKLCSIVDVVDQTRALVDGPETGVPRIPVRLNQLRLTKFVIKYPYKGSTRVVRKAWVDNKVTEKWKESKWAQNLADRKKRRRMSDFERFKLRHARKLRNGIRTLEYRRLLKRENQLKRKKLQKELKKKKRESAKIPRKLKKEGGAAAAAAAGAAKPGKTDKSPKTEKPAQPAPKKK